MKSVTININDAMAISLALNKYLNRLALRDEWGASEYLLRNAVNDLDHKIIDELRKDV